ncbi:Uncharacterised protein [Bordetella pertussis]|nr:Uncharacterised protein [Bordetella pertussis]CFW47179.1 Uncharacterised protein [Bordetella pertussis]
MGGVLPPTTILTSSGWLSSCGSLPTSSWSTIASTNRMSAPASAKRRARSMAASKPSTARASVRAMMRKSSSRRASAAALIFDTISDSGATLLPAKWPQRLGNTWSSSWMASAPARSSTRTVCHTLTALPKPVSASTIRGNSTASRMREVASATSRKPMMPRSGAP